jgi:hypothetical protein
MSTDAPPLPADLVAGLKRLRLAAMRTLAPELLVVAKTQRWNTSRINPYPLDRPMRAPLATGIGCPQPDRRLSLACTWAGSHPAIQGTTGSM